MKAPPQRVRIVKLQDAQLTPLVAIDLACKETLHRAGVPAAERPALDARQIGGLTKLHNVLVAEADGDVAGYVAWRDEFPGVAYVEELAVKPELQRLGIGSKLLDAVRAEARTHSLPLLIARSWTRAASINAFLEKIGLTPLAKHEGERVTQWTEDQQAKGPDGLVKEGQVVLVQSIT